MTARIISKSGERGVVEVGGTRYDVNFEALPQAQPGELVHIRAGRAVSLCLVAPQKTGQKPAPSMLGGVWCEEWFG